MNFPFLICDDTMMEFSLCYDVGRAPMLRHAGPRSQNFLHAWQKVSELFQKRQNTCWEAPLIRAPTNRKFVASRATLCKTINLRCTDEYVTGFQKEYIALACASWSPPLSAFTNLMWRYAMLICVKNYLLGYSALWNAQIYDNFHKRPINIELLAV